MRRLWFLGGTRTEILARHIDAATRDLGPVDGPTFDRLAARLRAEQPEVLRSLVAALAPLGFRPLHLALELFAVGWRALELARGRPSRRGGRRSYLTRRAELRAWMERMADVDPRLLSRRLLDVGELGQPDLVAWVVARLFEDPKAVTLDDGARALVFQEVLAAIGTLVRAGARRGSEPR